MRLPNITNSFLAVVQHSRAGERRESSIMEGNASSQRRQPQVIMSQASCSNSKSQDAINKPLPSALQNSHLSWLFIK